LSEKNKNQRLSICLLLRYKKEPFLEEIITCDEKWVLIQDALVNG
jgi:hypothetical protein